MALFGLSLLCAVAAFTLVDWTIEEQDSPAVSRGLSLLSSVGMDSVMQAKTQVDARTKEYSIAKARAQKLKVQLDNAEAKKVKMNNRLNEIDVKIDRETVKMSKDAAAAERDGDNANEMILKAREHEHNANAEHRHAATTLRRESREESSLAHFKKQALHLKQKATDELSDAKRRSQHASQLRAVARKHLQEASSLKRKIRDELRAKAASLTSTINDSQRAALRATEAAKAADKQYARLTQAANAHSRAARLAQRKADQAALAAEAADKQAALMAAEVSAELSVAQKDKKTLARLLSAASNPEGSMTLRSAVPFKKAAAHTLNAGDVSLGPNHSASGNDENSMDGKAARELRAAADQIRKLRAQKEAAERREAQERKAEDALEKAMKSRQQNAVNRLRQHSNGKYIGGGHPSRHPAPREYENNFEAAMNYLNNDHIDAASGIDDQGRDAVGREVEGRRALVGVFGRSPQLDAMATANLRQFEQDESELDRANYNGGDEATDKNIF